MIPRCRIDGYLLFYWMSNFATFRNLHILCKLQFPCVSASAKASSYRWFAQNSSTASRVFSFLPLQRWKCKLRPHFFKWYWNCCRCRAEPPRELKLTPASEDGMNHSWREIASCIFYLNSKIAVHHWTAVSTWVDIAKPDFESQVPWCSTTILKEQGCSTSLTPQISLNIWVFSRVAYRWCNQFHTCSAQLLQLVLSTRTKIPNWKKHVQYHLAILVATSSILKITTASILSRRSTSSWSTTSASTVVSHTFLSPHSVPGRRFSGMLINPTFVSRDPPASF